jgi:hypothetical protein
MGNSTIIANRYFRYLFIAKIYLAAKRDKAIYYILKFQTASIIVGMIAIAGPIQRLNDVLILFLSLTCLTDVSFYYIIT